jgi:sialic acid synthase SpsE
MCTAFSPLKYVAINRFVERHKIASSEITDLNIVETVNSFMKPVLLSTGGATYEEIDQALGLLGNCAVTLLYCVAEYPANVIDFRHMREIRGKYGNVCKIGYSDHSTDVLNIPMMAKIHNATVIEKHVNFCGYADTPDAPTSLSGEQFAMMVKHLRNDLSIEETRRGNPHKRIKAVMPDGSTKYFRPMADGT